MSIKKKAAAILSAVVAFVMALAVAAPAFAQTGTGNITVENANANQTYSAYKVFDVDYSVKADGNADQIAYTISDDSQFYTAVASEDSPFSVSTTNVEGTFNVSLKADKTIADVTTWFANLIKSGTYTATISGKASSDGTYVIGSEIEGAATAVSHGYYFVTTTTGSVVTVSNFTPNVKVQDKNVEPTVEKTIIENDVPFDENSASIGDYVTYQVTINAEPGALNYVLHDDLSEGLTLQESEQHPITVSVNGNNLTLGQDYSVNTTPAHEDGSSCDLEITFTSSFLSTITSKTEIIVSYTAMVNENAVKVNGNEAYLSYGQNSDLETLPDDTKTYVYDFILEKVDADNTSKYLPGAEFKLYDQETGGNLIWLIKVNKSIYRVATDDEIAANQATDTIVSINGGVTITGLEGMDPYWLEETKAPAGYNLLNGRIEVAFIPYLVDANGNPVDADGNPITRGFVGTDWEKSGYGRVVIENQAGSLLPSTGGMGTTVLYAVGAALVIGTGVTLVVRRRMNAEA